MFKIEPENFPYMLNKKEYTLVRSNTRNHYGENDSNNGDKTVFFILQMNKV